MIACVNIYYLFIILWGCLIYTEVVIEGGCDVTEDVPSCGDVCDGYPTAVREINSLTAQDNNEPFLCPLTFYILPSAPCPS